MPCPHCGDTRTEVLNTVRRGRSMYRVRRCSFCKSRFSTQERPVSWNHLNRKWPGRSPSRNGWKKHRAAALHGTCEVASCAVDFKRCGVRRHVDHMRVLSLLPCQRQLVKWRYLNLDRCRTLLVFSARIKPTTLCQQGSSDD